MANRFTFTLLLLIALITGAPAKSSSRGGGGGTTSSNTNVTTTVFDSDTSGAPLLFRSDDYNGNSNDATYTAVNNIGSDIDSSGVWHLNLYSQKTATMVYVTPNDTVGNEPTSPPAGYYWNHVEINSKCTDSSGNTVPFPNLVNGSSSCTFMVDFGYNGITYKLLIGRVLNATDRTPGEASVITPSIAAISAWLGRSRLAMAPLAWLQISTATQDDPGRCGSSSASITTRFALASRIREIPNRPGCRRSVLSYNPPGYDLGPYEAGETGEGVGTSGKPRADG